MGKPFSVNITRHDPYKSYNFLVYFEQSTTPVAGLSKMTGGLKRTSSPIDYKQGGALITLKGLGRTEHSQITLERGITHDNDFEVWANAALMLENGMPSVSLKKLRRNIRIELLNEERQPVHRYIVYHCWVSEFQALPDLDAGTNAVAIEHIRLENEGWEHDLSLSEPTEQ